MENTWFYIAPKRVLLLVNQGKYESLVIESLSQLSALHQNEKNRFTIQTTVEACNWFYVELRVYFTEEPSISRVSLSSSVEEHCMFWDPAPFILSTDPVLCSSEPSFSPGINQRPWSWNRLRTSVLSDMV